MELSCDVPLPLPLEELRAKEPDQPTLVSWLVGMGFRSTVEPAGPGRAPPASPEPEPRGAGATPEQPPFGGYACVTDPADLAAWIAEARAPACRPGHADRRAGRAAGEAGRRGARHRAEARLLRPAGPPPRGGPAQLTLDAPARRPAALPQIEAATALGLLAPLLADAAVLKVAHDAKYDLMVLERAGIPGVGPVDDAMLISYAQGAGAHAHGLDELALRNLGHKPAAIESVTGTGRARLPFAWSRSTAPPTTRRNGRMWRCACGTRCARGCAPRAACRCTSSRSAGWCRS